MSLSQHLRRTLPASIALASALIVTTLSAHADPSAEAQPATPTLVDTAAPADARDPIAIYQQALVTVGGFLTRSGLADSAQDLDRTRDFLSLFRHVYADPQAPLDEAQCALATELLPQWIQSRGNNRYNDPAMAPEATFVLDAARLCNTEALHVAALQNLGYVVGAARASHWPVTIQRAVIRYTTLNADATFARVDPRVATPTLDTLHDIKDFRGMERVLEQLDKHPITARLTGIPPYRTLASEGPEARLTIQHTKGCSRTLDGTPVTKRNITVRSGTWRVGCKERENDFTIVTVPPGASNLSDAPVILTVGPKAP